ncbi:MAG: 50S ribosomal protein L10 [Mycoplasmoidaceae bacterium]
MRKAIQIKGSLCKKYSEKIKESFGIIVFKYIGLDAEDMTILRRDLKKNNASMHVLKNNIIIRSLELAGYKDFSNLSNGNAIVICNGDEIVPLKMIKKLMEKNDFLLFQGSVIQKQYMDGNNTLMLSSLPSRNEMYQMLLSCLTFPIRSFMYGLKSISDLKNDN